MSNAGVQGMAYSQEDTVKLLADKAKASGDRFVVKISRRRGMAGMLEHIATLAEASLSQVASPETWLPALCGGGDFGLAVSHMDDSASRIGGFLLFKFPGPQLETPRSSVVASPNWQGPGVIVFPTAVEAPSFGGAPSFSGPPGFVNVGQPQPAPTFGAPPQQVPGFVGLQPGDLHRADIARMQQEQSERMLREREFELREKERESKIKDEFTAKQRELELKLQAQAQSGMGMKEILAAVAPLMTMFMQTSAQARIEQQRLADEQAKRAEEAQRRSQEMFMQMQAQAQQQLNGLMLKMAEPKGMDPSVTMMLEMMRNNQSGSAEMMTRIVDAMGAVSKTSVGMIEAIADMQLGGAPEHPILQAVREGVKAMASLSAGATSGARKTVQANQQQPRLPAQAQPARPAQAGAAPAQAPVAQVVAQAPNPPAPNMPQAFDGLPANAAAPVPTGVGSPVEGSVIDRLKELAMAHHEPVEDVARFFIEGLKTKELQDALNNYNGDVNQLIAEHLGLWAMSDEKNRDYIGRVGEALDKMGSELGLVAEEGGEDESEDEGEEA